MPLSPVKQKLVTELATSLGLDPAELMAEAESMMKPAPPSGVKPKPNDKPPPPSKAPTTEPTPAQEQPKLFMYHLPFVTVNEVRTRWLGLDAWTAEEGGDDIASAFAAVNTAPADGTPPDATGTGLPSVTPDDAIRIRDIIGRSKPRKPSRKVTPIKP